MIQFALQHPFYTLVIAWIVCRTIEGIVKHITNCIKSYKFDNISAGD